MKHTKKLLSVLLSLLMVFSFAAFAFALGGEPNWVPIPTSDEGLQKGDLYLDLDKMLPIVEDSVLSDLACEKYAVNNLGRMALKYFAFAYPDQWAAANESASGYDAEDLFWDWVSQNEAEILAAVNQDLGLELTTLNAVTGSDYNTTRKIGVAYLNKYDLDLIAQANQAVAAKMEELRTVQWEFDVNYSGWDPVRGTLNGEEYSDYLTMYLRDMVTEAGIVWKPVQIVESEEGLEDGAYYLDRAALEEAFAAEFYVRSGGEETIPVFDPIAGPTSMTKEDYINKQMQKYTLFINEGAPETSLFRFRLDYSYELMDGTGATVVQTETGYLPRNNMSDDAAINLAFLAANVKQYQAPAVEPDEPGTPDTPDTPDEPGSNKPAGKDTWISILFRFLTALLRLLTCMIPA